MRQSGFCLGQVSRMRGCLFGIAMFAIMVFHSPIPTPQYTIRFIKVFGNIGVEIFLVLSAVGLHRSMCADLHVGRFYYKRALRTVLPLLPVVVFWFGYYDLLGGAGWRAFLEDVTMISFWTRGLRTEWFVACILVLYLAYPLLHRLRCAKCGALWIGLLTAAFVAVNIIWCARDPVSYERTEIAVSRVPVFLLGCLIAPAVNSDRRMPRGTMAVCAALFAALFVWKYLAHFEKPWSRLINALLGLLLTILLAALTGALKDRPVARQLERFFVFLGGFTLELYLLHEKILHVLQQVGFPAGAKNLLLSAAAIVLAIPSAWLYGKICGWLRKRLPQPRRS